MTGRELIIKLLQDCGTHIDDEVFVTDVPSVDFDAYSSQEVSIVDVRHEYRRGFHIQMKGEDNE